jgi:hypothetical protein
MRGGQSWKRKQSKASLDWHAASMQGKPLCPLLLERPTVFFPLRNLTMLSVSRIHDLRWQEERRWLGFQVITAMLMKGSIFRDITPCSPLKVNWSFGRTYRLHLQSRRRIQARNQQAASRADGSYAICHLLSLWFLAWFILQLWRWRRHVSPNRRLAFNGLHLRR